MYSAETLKNTVEKLKMAIDHYRAMNTDDYNICISEGNSKIGKALNVSLAPIVTCANCKQCMKYCYDVKACFQYKNVVDARARNTALFMENRNEFFNRLHKRMMNRKKNFYLRFHVSGEIVDYDHFSRMVETAKLFPHFTIWTYTKVYWIVNEYVKRNGGKREIAIPENFHVMFSEWRGLRMDNPYNFPVFACVFTSQGEEMPKDKYVCPGNCNICKECKRGCIIGESVNAHDH